MASLTQLQTDVADWLNRQDMDARMGSWVRMAETDIAELLRARCMVTQVVQPIDAALISLPADFLEMEQLQDHDTGRLLSLEDYWTGPNANDPLPVRAWRLVGNCIEFLPHPIVPNPPDPTWQPQQVDMTYYQRPRPLLDPQDTNPVLETLYGVYLFATLRYAAKWALDPDRAQQAEADLTEQISAANKWKDKTDYSGAPLRAVVRSFGW